MKIFLRCMKNVEFTLAVLKPDICKHPTWFQEVKQKILDAGFIVCRSRIAYLSLDEAQKFYNEHRNKFFYNRLITFISSGPVFVSILARDNAIKRWRELMGPTKIFRSRYEFPNTIRGSYGLTDTRNVVHGSDSVETATREIKFFFPDFDENKHLDDNDIGDKDPSKYSSEVTS
ncbi:NME6 (predicted) [Pycnogonum litorale]